MVSQRLDGTNREFEIIVCLNAVNVWDWNLQWPEVLISTEAGIARCPWVGWEEMELVLASYVRKDLQIQDTEH
jgi:hypothetical protein